MRNFIDLARGQGPYEQLQGPLRVRKAKAYEEIEWPTGLQLPSFVLYRLSVTSSISTIAACCGNAFDAMLAAMQQHDDQLLSEVAQYWVNFAQMVVNGQKGDLSDRALVRITDPDDGVKKSFVATTLEEGYGSAQKLRQAVVRVIEGSVSCVGQGKEAASIRPRIAALIAPPNDLHQFDQLLHTLAYSFPLGDLEGMLERS
jgi:hypothetical protein